MANVHDFSAKTIDGKDKSLADYKGKVLLVVNVASECGYTPQYAGLEELYKKYKDKGLVVLGFPANEFGAQEPGTDQQIQTFCQKNYGVSFDMFSKVKVQGEGMHPLFDYLQTHPKLGSPIKWNFYKYLIGKDGEPIGKFPSKVEPLSEDITGAVEKALG
jgi:glutathione peroxidase